MRRHCPDCQSDALKVLESRPKGDMRTRRYSCKNCGHRFSTREREIGRVGAETKVVDAAHYSALIGFLGWMIKSHPEMVPDSLMPAGTKNKS